jgi:hypothetical protein
LAIAGVISGIRTYTGVQSKLGKRLELISGSFSGALIGFFYGGIWSHNNSQIAILGAVAGGLLLGIMGVSLKKPAVAIAITVAGAVNGYGFAFLMGSWAITLVSVQQFARGILFSLVSLGSVRLVLHSVAIEMQQMQTAVGTSFRNADLTHANFEGAQLHNTDFSGVIGNWTGMGNL